MQPTPACLSKSCAEVVKETNPIFTLGIDVGTGGTRALIVDHQGRVLGSATQEHVPFASPHIGWAEQEPQDWWRACTVAVPLALQRSGLSGNDIACVGFSGQMHGAVMLDAEGNVVRPALIWCDVRTDAQCRELTEKIGADKIVQLTCNPPLANFTLTKLMWVRENEAANWDRVCSFMLPKDYVRFRLTGEKACDVADASGTLLLDVANRRWSEEILEATSLDRSMLPALYESQEICGKVSDGAAAATGLRAGTPVVAGAGDQAAGAVGMGIVEPGSVSVTIGTSGVVFAATDCPTLDRKGRLHTFCHAVPRRWHVMGVTQAAGLSLRWFRDQFGTPTNDGREPYEQLMDEAAIAPPGSNGLMWTPYLMGERTPHLDPQARAALIGLTAVHKRADVIRAILEGVAFSLRDTFTILEEMRVPCNRVRLGGGGARSELWRQIQADVYRRDVATLEAEEGAAYGAALLAGVGCGMWSSVDEATTASVRESQRISPRAETSKLLNESYARYRRIYGATREIFNDGKSDQLPTVREEE